MKDSVWIPIAVKDRIGNLWIELEDAPMTMKAAHVAEMAGRLYAACRFTDKDITFCISPRKGIKVDER